MIRVYLILTVVSFQFAQESIFNKANSAFQGGDYAAALEYYQQIESNNLESAELYFNMANSYFKLEQIGKAILYYEKAKKLNPLDEDILANFKLAKKQVLDDIELPDQLFIFDLYQSLKFSFTINQWLLFSLSLFAAVFVLLWLKRWFLENLATAINAAVIIFLSLFVLSALMSVSRIVSFETEHGVVLVQTSEVYTNPTENNQAFVLHEGTSFEIKRELNNRYEISLIDGKTGWISVDDIGVI